jgi:hypothetical protein
MLTAGDAKKALVFVKENQQMVSGGSNVTAEVPGTEEVQGEGDKEKGSHVQSTMQVDDEHANAIGSESEKENSKPKLRSFRRIPREDKKDKKQAPEEVGRKRGREGSEDREVEESRLAKLGKSAVAESQTPVAAERQTGSVGINEDHSLELPGVGKCPSSSRASELLEVGEGRCAVFVGNKIRREKDEKFAVEVGFRKHGSGGL